jgi:hypothetical protein
MQIEITKVVGEPPAEFMACFNQIEAVVDQLAGHDAFTVANALASVAANVLLGAGMTHSDVADLLEVLALLSRDAAKTIGGNNDQGGSFACD